MPPSPGRGMGSTGSSGGYGAPLSTEPLPASVIYAMSCEAFSRPVMEPQATAWREGEIAGVAPWAAPTDPARRAFRVREIETSIARCRTITAPKLREQVLSVDTAAVGTAAPPSVSATAASNGGLSPHSISALVFHPYHPLVCCADRQGFIKVCNFTDSTCINAFHVASGAAPADARGQPPPASDTLPTAVTFLQQINEADGPMLLAGSADGAVRVWRSYTMLGGWGPDNSRQPGPPSPSALLPQTVVPSPPTHFKHLSGTHHTHLIHQAHLQHTLDRHQTRLLIPCVTPWAVSLP